MTGGFCRWRMMRWRDRNGADYIVGLARNPRLKRLARRWDRAMPGRDARDQVVGDSLDRLRAA